MPFTILTQGSFTQPATAVPQSVLLPSSADYFITTNLTQMALSPATPVVVRAEWYKNLTAVNSGLRWKKGSSLNSIFMDTFANATASNGFTYVSTPPQPEAAVTGTAITAANPAVVTMNNTYSEGDTVVLYNTTGMLQIAGQSFTISSVSGTGFTLLGLDASGFAAPATAVTARRIAKLAPVEPRFMYVTKISQALQAVVTVSQAHQYVVGQLIHFSIPQSMGMQEMNNLTGKIVAVGTYTMTVDINSSAFSAFAYPLSTSSPTAALFATIANAGQRAQYDPVTQVTTGYNFQYVPFHSGQFTPYMYLPAGAQSPGGAAGDTIVWQAYKMENS